MDYLFSMLILVAGVAGGMLYFRTASKRWTVNLNKAIDAFIAPESDHKIPTEKSGIDELPHELAAVLRKLETVRSNQSKNGGNGSAEVKQDDAIVVLRKLIDNLYIVNDLGQKVTSSLNLDQTFRHLYTTINSMMDAAVLELTVHNEITGGRNYFSNLGLKEDDAGYVNTMAEWSFKNNREVFLADAERDFARYVFQPLVLPGGQVAKSVMVFPVLKGDQVTGTLSIISFKQGSFETYHQEIIRSLLGYISVAIENALTHDELNRTKIRAEESERFKEQFLANMSHEIRTPINAVNGMTQLLLDKHPREDQLRYLESIRNASDSLLVIINDILDLSKIEAGKVELEQIDFSVEDVLRNVRDIMHFKAEEKGLSLNLRHDQSSPPHILIGDPTRLSQVLINLVGNAVKFTDKGSVTISVSSSDISKGADDHQKVLLGFAITDTGIGMTEEQQGKLFMDYAQASSDTTRKYGGTGLGLSISRQLVQLQEGTISVKSAPGEGSTFSFSIPYRVSKSKTVATRQPQMSDEMLRAMKCLRVLLADDNEYNRIVARETIQLKLSDAVVDEAVDGQGAIDLLRSNRYDVVMMDLVMPGMDGIEATRIIRRELPAPVRDIPILALTASVIKSEIDKCMEAGMNGFVPKPFKPHELLVAIFNALHKKGAPALNETAVIPRPPPANGKLVDLDYLKEFSEGDPVRLQRLIDLFLKKVPESLTRIREAYDANDLDKIRIAAHSMKPQLRFTGVKQGLDLAETIEQNCSEGKEREQLPGLIEDLTRVCNQAIAELKSPLTS